MNNTIAFEIGTEEIPAIELHNATTQIYNLVCNKPCKLFDYDEIKIYSTPRRLIVTITGVPEKIEAKVVEHKGPKLAIAKKDGEYTKAALGFARSKGIDASDLIEKDDYVYAIQSIPEKYIIDMLPGLFIDLIKSIKWKKVQRWANRGEEFSRPIRWFFAMFGDKVIDFEYAGVKSGSVTYGHRFLCPGKIQLENADMLIETLQNSYVVVTEQERESIIRKQVKCIEERTNLVAELPNNVLSEVVNLCEYPTCMVGKFDNAFLDVPKEIIVDAMLVHQRYFPLFDKNGNLTNYFIIVSNGDSKFENNIVDGNQRVVAARLYDAKFFVEEDKKHPLEYYVNKLNDVVFHEQLGTMELKANRIAKISEYVAKECNFSADDIKNSKRAGMLAKADLVTSAVIEFTQVQGIMGYYYAINSHEKQDVCLAIKEHYMPKFAGGNLPSTNTGKCVAIADKLDSLCSMFAVNQMPTGSSDPFALRRGTLGIINIMRSGLDFSLANAINFTLNLLLEQGISFDYDEVFENVCNFIITRTKVILKDMGINHDSIEAVSAINIVEPIDFINRTVALDKARISSPEDYDDLATAFARANNLRQENLGSEYDENLLNNHEQVLCSAIDKSSEIIAKNLYDKNYTAVLSELSRLREPIDNFFNNVMIMDKDEKIKENRLKILNSFVDVFSNIADFSKMSKK